MRVNNSKWKKIGIDDYLFFTIGHEERSVYLYNQVASTRNKDNTTVFCFDRRGCHEKLIAALRSKGFLVIECSYTDSKIVSEKIVSTALEKDGASPKNSQIHIDYSAMPRSWYCTILLQLGSIQLQKFSTCFWYTAGDYPRTHKRYPSAAIDSISVFSGVSLPTVDISRYHIMGIGFDGVRTETVKSIIEPDNLICCYAYNPNHESILRQIQDANKRVIRSSALTVSVPLDNFKGIVDKLCGLTYDLLLKNAQVVFVPDGPKPLIMAMSIVPYLINEPGVTCLHISSNTTHYPLIDIAPRHDEIFGFQVLP